MRDPRGLERWERTLARHRVANRYLGPRWAALYARVYGMPVRCFAVAGADGTYDLLLPVARVRSLLFGDGWIGLPFVNAAGVWWNPAALGPSDVRATVADIQAHLGRPLVMRGGADAVPVGGIPAASEKAGFERPLPVTEDALWASFPPKLRAQVRRPAKAGYTGRRGGPEVLGDFHRVYCATMRDLGSPPHGRGFFAHALGALDGDAGIVIVYGPDGDPAAAGFLVRHGARLEIPWAGATREASRDAPNMLLYERALVAGIEMGCTTFDFGRSTADSGQARFKGQWGAQGRPLHWERFGGAEAARTVAEPGRVMRSFTRMWSHLPMPVVRALGPHIIRRIPA